MTEELAALNSGNHSIIMAMYEYARQLLCADGPEETEVSVGEKDPSNLKILWLYNLKC